VRVLVERGKGGRGGGRGTGGRGGCITCGMRSCSCVLNLAYTCAWVGVSVVNADAAAHVSMLAAVMLVAWAARLLAFLVVTATCAHTACIMCWLLSHAVLDHHCCCRMLLTWPSLLLDWLPLLLLLAPAAPPGDDSWVHSRWRQHGCAGPVSPAAPAAAAGSLGSAAAWLSSSRRRRRAGNSARRRASSSSGQHGSRGRVHGIRW
jgi:hypothetical protein